MLAPLAHGGTLLSLRDLVAAYGYPIVGSFITLEGMGVPLPGEVVLLTASALAAQANLGIVGVVASAWIGTLLGGSGGYWIGRRGGAAALDRYGRYIGVTPARRQWAEGFFERHGAKTVVVARFVAILRMLVGVLAGMTRMSFPAFSVANAVGGLLWSVTFGAIGYLFGSNLPLVERYIRRAGIGTVVAVVAVAALIWWWRRRRSAREL